MVVGKPPYHGGPLSLTLTLTLALTLTVTRGQRESERERDADRPRRGKNRDVRLGSPKLSFPIMHLSKEEEHNEQVE